MKVFVILSVLLVATHATHQCFDDITNACNNVATKPIQQVSDFTKHCSSRTGHFIEEQKHLQAYAENLIKNSYDYLLLSVNFGQYKNNRDGLRAYYRKLSDQTWEDAIDLIKYITKRGGIMKFGVQKSKKSTTAPNMAGTPEQGAVNKNFKSYLLNEIESLAKALDIQKSLANEALRMYGESLNLKTYEQKSHMDGSIAHYLKEKFIEPQMDRVRELTGHFNDLQKMLREEAQAISVFMFDEFLKKSL